MSRKLALIPASWLERKQQQPFGQQPTAAPPEIRVFGLSEQNDLVDSLADYFPKTQRNRAKLFLTHLRDKITLDAQNRIVYTPQYGGSGEAGSSIIDLVRYFISSKLFSPARPPDASRFAEILVSLGLPKSALGPGRTLGSEQRRKAMKSVATPWSRLR